MNHFCDYIHADEKLYNYDAGQDIYIYNGGTRCAPVRPKPINYFNEVHFILLTGNWNSDKERSSGCWNVVAHEISHIILAVQFHLPSNITLVERT